MAGRLEKAGYDIALFPLPRPPGRGLRFQMHGWREDGEKRAEPAPIAGELDKVAEEYYVPADETWPEDA